MWSIRTQLCLLLTVTSLANVLCVCRQSFMTLCDTFEDFNNYNDSENLQEVIIGSDEKNVKISVNLMNILKLDKYQLSSLIIVNSINNLESTYHYECLYITSTLKYLSLYNNDLKHIERYHFPLMPLKKLSLVNNKIESLGKEAFYYQSMEILDLSNNLLETLEYRSLPSTKVTKVLFLRNNKITHIPAESFPVSLESLYLNRNKLRYLQSSVFKNLKNLQQLTLSHNKLTEIPEIQNLTHLVIFDISYNEIEFVFKDKFENLNKLRLLDLSNNKIASLYVLKWLDVPEKHHSLIISLAMNKLKDLDLKDLSLQNRTVILYGNPWNCSRWSDLKKSLNGHESECDMEFLADEKNPFCLSYSFDYNFTKMWETDVDLYHNVVKKNKKVHQCSLELKKHQLLYPVDYFCVFVKD